MIFITQIIYIIEGKEDIFNQFEEIAIAAISKYNGEILLRVRPNKNDIIEGCLENPYEIHLVQFPTEKDFNEFIQDEERKKFLYVRDQSIRSVIMIKGIKL